MNNETIKIIKNVERSMECVLESDPRTFTNPECEYGWIFTKISEWRKELNMLIDD